MRYYPVHLDLVGRRVLVVGGGEVARGKVEQLLEAGASVTVVSREVNTRLRELASQEVIQLRIGSFVGEDLDGAGLVITATNDRGANALVTAAARRRGIWCNAVDQPELCDFITPAVVCRGDLQIGVSTGGGSPTLAQRVKREIEGLIGEEYGELLELASDMRREVRANVSGFDRRRDLLRAFVESEALDLLRNGQRQAAIDLARKMVEQTETEQCK